MEAITIRLSEDLKKQLQELCEKQSRPFSEVVRDSLRQYLAVQKFQMLRKKALPFAESQGLLTDEDVFKAVS